jgi:conjugative relaxase-like TrwC/TraI family protein
MEGYYTGAIGDGEPPGRWSGTGAAALGLVGEVDAEVMHAVYHGFADPRDARFADPETRNQAAQLGRPPKQFRTPDQVVAARVDEYTKLHSSAPMPEQVQAWRIEAERSVHRAVQFYDATFSPPKSVTVAHAAFLRAAHEADAAGRVKEAAAWQARAEAIDAAVTEANDATLAYLSQHAGYSRIGRHTGKTGGTGRWVDAHGLVVASFYQHTSRDHDPQLHVHNAVLNRVECPDGQWRALDGRALHAAIQGAGAVGSAVLQGRLSQELGVSWLLREDGNDFEIAEVDPEVMDLFSSRTKTLTRRAEEMIGKAEAQLGRPLNSLERYRLAKSAGLATRRAKTHDSESEAERLQRWDAELQTEVAGGLLRSADQLTLTRATRLALWSPDTVIEQALEAVHGGDEVAPGRSVWSRSDLFRRIHLALPPNLGLDGDERVELAKRLTDQALERAVLVSGREVGDLPCPDRLDNGMSAAAAPYEHRYATPGHLAAETALLDALGVRGRHCVDRRAIDTWLESNGEGLSAAQREAVAGLAASDTARAVLVGPAGTGKSFTAGTLAAAWDQLTGGRVIGLATAETAAQVLVDDGLADSTNIAAFLTAQARLAADRPLPGDHRWHLGPRDTLVVDEASMLDTDRLTALHRVADAAGARVVLMGDPHQLGAVGAGGMMRTTIDRGAETYTLSDVRRFTADWEREASLRIRDGDPAAVLAYDRHGRLRDGGRLDDTITAVARAAAADRLAGREVIVTCGSNTHAATVSAAVRHHLVDAGLVDEAGVVLGRDHNTAGVGDLVQARRIDRRLGLINRENYRVTAVRDDGGLDVVSTRSGRHLVMPTDYVAADACLAYASTAHAAQGATVDAGHLLLTPELDRAAAYVGLTRGRHTNTAWAVTEDAAADPDQPPTTARAILDGRIRGEDDAIAAPDASALDTQTADDAHRFSPATLLARIEDQTRIACRERLDADLDQLVADGLLTEQDRARFGAEQGSEHLARQLRALETAGLNPRQVLRQAVTQRDYAGAVSVAAATAARIDQAHGLPIPTTNAGAPERIHPTRHAYLTALNDLLSQRQHQVGDQLAVQPPAWAINVLGPVPDDHTARADWAGRAGRIDVVREATGWDDPSIPLGRSPGVSTPEKRLTWSQAWAAAGMPEEKRPAADLSDGQLRVRIAAGERVNAHAPAAIYEQQRMREQQAADAARDAVLARTHARDEEAARLHQEAASARADADRLDLVNQARGEWLLAHAETLRAADDARGEADRRGLNLDHEPDQDTAENWLAHQRAAEQSDETHRAITDADVTDRPPDLELTVPPIAEQTTRIEPDLGHDHTAPRVSAHATAAETTAVAAHASNRLDQLADQASHDATEHAAAVGAAEDAEWRRRQQAAATTVEQAADASVDRG